MRGVLALVLLGTLLGAGNCQTPAAKLAQVKATTAKLRADVWNFWFTKGLDANGLGVYGTLDRTGAPISPTYKTLIQQARHLWAFSASAGLLDKERAKGGAAALHKLLTTKFYDAKAGTFVTKVAADGSVLDNGKSFTGNMYAVFALARYGRTFNVASASSLAYAVFKKWDAACYIKGRGWVATRSGTDKVALSQDSAVHILEALTELWQTFPKNAFIRNRLVAAVDILALRIMLSEGGKYSHREFEGAWKRVGNSNVEFGHELVGTWMLLNLAPKLQAAGLITAAKAKQIRARAIKTGAYTAGIGYDSANGGFWTIAEGGTKPDTSQKVWWQQAEGALAMYQLYQATKNVKYLDQLVATVNWISESQRDKTYGEWYWAVSPSTKKVMEAQWPGTWKGLEWKAAYHSGRSVLFLASWLNGQAVF